MKTIAILPLSITLITLSCENNTTEKPDEKATYKQVVSRYEMPNGKNFIIVNKGDTTLTAVELGKAEQDSLTAYKFFQIQYRENNGVNKVTKIERTKEDTTWKRQLLVAGEDNIEDYKRKKEGSYTIIEQGEGNDLIVVSTPSQEISKMLRIEGFKFYYYHNWDGKYYFDHIEEESDSK